MKTQQTSFSFGNEDWTNAKVDIITEYAKAFLNVMKNKNFSLYYIDAFAGCGTNIDSDNEIVLKSIARSVLSLKHSHYFGNLIFIDKNINNTQGLRNMINSDFSARRNICTVYTGEANFRINAIADQYSKNNDGNRGVVVLDPFGNQVRYETLRTISKLNIDTWILFPIGTINRLMPYEQEPNVPQIMSAYGISQDQTLEFWKRRNQRSPTEATDYLLKGYFKRVGELFPHVSEYYELRNSRNNLMYVLFLAARHALAKKIADAIVEKFNLQRQSVDK